MSDDAHPLPTLTEDNRRFWEAARGHRLALPHCPDCQACYWPAAPVCPYCLAGPPRWAGVSGKGTVSTWVRVHQPWFPSFASELPYNVAQVELDEGPRLTTSLVGLGEADPVVGMRVEVVFDDVTDTLTLPRFKPCGPDPAPG